MIAANEWMRGKCWEMAVALHKVTKFSIYGLFDDAGDCHHAFVMTADGKGIDARGLQALDRMRQGCCGGEVRPLSITEIESRWVGRKLDSAEIRAARREIEKNSGIKWGIQSAFKTQQEMDSPQFKIAQSEYCITTGV